MQNLLYVLGGSDGRGILVDPAWDVAGAAREAAAMGVTLTDALVTHGHPDHVNGLADARRLGMRVWAHDSSDAGPDERLRDGETRDIAGLRVEVRHTPGHRFDAACYVVEGSHLLTGDTLFVGECGRVDLPGGDVDEMWRTLNERLPALDPRLVVCPGHDYGARPLSTLGDELRSNYTMRRRSRAEFRAFMAEP